MMDLRHGKKRKMITVVVAVLLVIGMVVPTVLGALLSVFG